MTEIFVANGTYRNTRFQYRLHRGQERPMELVIPPGRQAKFPGHLDEMQSKYIIEQLQRYGAVHVSDVNSIIYTGALVFSEKKIVSDKINRAREKDEQVRQEVSAQKTEESGLAQFDAAGSHSDVVRKTLESTTLEVVEMGEHDRERRGGVDVQIAVSRKAGKRSTTRRRG